MDNFYVTLPSNVQSFSENTVANYKTKLASRLTLTDDWEVGLVDVSYTLSWYNIPKDEKFSLFAWEMGDDAADGKIGTYKLYDDLNLSLPKGRYDDIKQVVDTINNKIVAIDDENLSFKSDYIPSLNINESNRLITLSNGVLSKNNICVFIGFSKNLCEILGFNYFSMTYKALKWADYYEGVERGNKTQGITNFDYKFPNPTKELLFYTSEQPYELSGGYHSLFIYSDIVSPSFVGDSFTQLLRLVEIPSNYKFGDQVKITYSNTYYVPVLVKEFDTIEIDIKDDTGERVPFEFGRSIITLHFRKVYKRSDNMFL